MAYTQKMTTQDKDHIEISPCEEGIKLNIAQYNFSASIILTPEECKELRRIIQAGVAQFNKNERERYNE